MDKHNKDDSLTLLFYLFIRQMAGLADCFRRVQRDHLFATGKLQGWRDYIQTELGDIIMLIERTCTLFDLDYEETRTMGRKRDAEKSKEYLKRHPEEFWV